MTTHANRSEQGWTNTVGAPAAKAVSDVIGPLATSSFAPRPPVGGMIKALEAALEMLGLKHAGIVTASVSDPEPFLASLSGDARRFVDLRPRETLARAIAWRIGLPFHEELDAKLVPFLKEAASPWADGLRGRLWLELVRRPSQDGRNEHGELGMMILQTRWSVATNLAGFTALGEDANVAPALRTILELITLGNAPLGRLGSGEFLLVTG